MSKNRRQPISEPVDFPIGTFIQTEKGYFYINGPGSRYRLITQRVLESWKPHRIVQAAESALQRYAVKGKMKFRNGSLLYSQASGRMYLVSANKLRHITNPDVLDRIGAVRGDAVWVSLAELNLHEQGELLN